MKKRIRKINKFKDFPIETQNEVLNYLISKGKETLFGSEHNFNQISDYDSFKKEIPLSFQ